MLALTIQAVVLLQMENFLDEKQNLNQPILAERPPTKIFLQLELAGCMIDQRMEYFRLEMHDGHLLRIFGRNSHSKFENGILIDSLPDKVNSFPEGERRAGVVGTLLGRHQKDSNWRIFLE